MKNLHPNRIELEIAEFHRQQAKIANEQSTLSKMEKAIIKKYCPFEVGDKVVYTEWWRGNEKGYFGIVKNIKFNGINEDAINNRWVIAVETTTKDFKSPKGGYNRSYKYLGEDKRDIIRKYILT